MISAKDINAMQTRKTNMRKDLFKEILQQFSKRIKMSVELGHTQVFLTVPQFVVGYPTFDREFARKYLTRQLELLGYTVVQYSDFDIYVTWEKQAKQEAEDMDILPSLVNLRKTADGIRKKHGS